MINGPYPARFRQRFALGVRNGDDRHILELGEQRRQFRHVETTVHGRDVCDGQTPHNRQMELRDMKVDDIEFVRALRDLFEHQDMRRERIANAAVEAQRVRPYRDQTRQRLGIAAGEEGHIVAQPDELVRQECDNSFGPSVQSWRNAFK